MSATPPHTDIPTIDPVPSFELPPPLSLLLPELGEGEELELAEVEEADTVTMEVNT